MGGFNPRSSFTTICDEIIGSVKKLIFDKASRGKTEF